MMRVCYSDGRPSKWIDEDNMTDKLKFTDDDLMRLKEAVEAKCNSRFQTDKTITGGVFAVEALIARLEAAEKCAWWADYGATYIPLGNLDDCNQALENWRKAAGK